MRVVRKAATHARRVGPGNIEALAEWVDGSVGGTKRPKKEWYVSVTGSFAATMGMWIVKEGDVFSTHTDEEFHNLFKLA